MEIKMRDLSLIAIFSALYATMVLIFAPISFYALQFRVAGILRPAIVKKRVLALGYAIGVVLGNLLSPFPSFYELVFMPFVSFIAGFLAHVIGRMFKQSYFIAGVIIATMISFSVSWMLNQLFAIPIIVSFPSLFVSEQIVCLIGTIIFKAIETKYVWWED